MVTIIMIIATNFLQHILNTYSVLGTTGITHTKKQIAFVLKEEVRKLLNLYQDICQTLC